ncbi:allantoate amidohydrolase [Aeromicrobium endophyticum]|uniref:Allantoate amidohydrolase n=1 Tax=Aeromicrobium endophyticum TaxID=2292704 RepID=A0A371NZ78_9ACTN|nr:allantoate amidohydrolase [Aeromicrobium endophyticum]REK68901.1 allantoate amidohydrolase [Aeromicrobium endophyticum]
MSHPSTVSGLLTDVRQVGRDARRGGYSRFTYSDADLELREWFVAEASRRSLDVDVDRNGAIWAWRPGPGGSLEDAVVTGSHVDSVPGGGEFDGPLGIASALVAVDHLDASGARLDRPLAVVLFPEEEGARFGQACLGSQLMTGAFDPVAALDLRDVDGVSLAEALRRGGIDPTRLGRDDQALSRIGAFVELHVEQGRGLIDLGQPVAIASSIIGHGLWRLTVSGEGNHAGATAMDHRRDPLVAAAAVIALVRDAAREVPGARATVGRVQPIPGGTNVIASRVDVWVDVRHDDDQVARSLVSTIFDRARRAAALEGCDVTLTEQSYGGSVDFDPTLRDRLAAVLPEAPILRSGAGHDAGVLADVVPTAMLFTRNPTGISHSPEEQIEEADAESGAAALADVLRDLLTLDEAPPASTPGRP